MIKNMKKRILLITLSVILVLTPLSAAGNEPENTSDKSKFTYEELHKKRLELSLNYDDNWQEIEEIDELLGQYGDSEITENELKDKILMSNLNTDKNIPSSIYNPTAQNNIRWTSRRYNQVYAGQVFEIQEILGESSGYNSPLRQKINKSVSKSGNFKAGSTTAFKTIFTSVMGMALDSVAEGLSLGITLFQLVGSYDKNIATSSSIKYIDLDFTVNYVSNEKFVFVKRYGAGDSEQILCYVGNNVISEVMTSYSADIYANGVIIQPSSQQKKYIGSVSNTDYNSTGSVAAKNYYMYKNYNKTFDEYAYLIKNVTFETMEGSVSCNIAYVST